MSWLDLLLNPFLNGIPLAAGKCVEVTSSIRRYRREVIFFHGVQACCNRIPSGLRGPSPLIISGGFWRDIWGAYRELSMSKPSI